MLSTVRTLALAALLAPSALSVQAQTATEQTATEQAAPAQTATEQAAPAQTATGMTVTSAEMADGGTLAKAMACGQQGGKTMSPALTVSNLPEGTKFLTVIMDDPDAKKVAGKVWVHWNLSDIPAETTTLPSAKRGKTAKGITGAGDGGKGYDGVCPPARHGYVLTVYATSAEVGKLTRVTRAKFEKTNASVILGKATLTASFP